MFTFYLYKYICAMKSALYFGRCNCIESSYHIAIHICLIVERFESVTPKIESSVKSINVKTI